ncbi:MAG: signal peptidase II [Gammaproteobacteria bacterium]|nr:signal peptidase II [Gammaproteobacteria bacterium]
MSGSHRLRLVAPLLLTCLLIDQITKQLASQTLSPLISKVWLNGVVRLIYAENTGIMQSIGDDLPGEIRLGLFTLLPSLLIIGLLLVVFLRRQPSRIFLIGSSLVIGGGMGNLLDRLFNEGAVIDFVYLVLWGRMTGIFNFADLSITIGTVVLIFLGLARVMRLQRFRT